MATTIRIPLQVVGRSEVRTMVITDEHDFEDNAEAIGWTKTVPNTEKIDEAQALVDAALPGSIERIQAQKALQLIQSTPILNPVTAVDYVIAHCSAYIQKIAVDPVVSKAEETIMTEANAKIEEAKIEALRSKISIEVT